MFGTQRILVPVDYTDVAAAAASAAIQLAAFHKATLYVLHVNKEMDGDFRRKIVTAPSDHGVEESIAYHERNMKEFLEKEYVRAAEAGHVIEKANVEFIIAGGDWFETTMGIVEDEKIDLIVTGTHGPQGMRSWLFGTKSEQLVHKSDCSVFVVKPQGYPYLRD